MWLTKLLYMEGNSKVLKFESSKVENAKTKNKF